MNEFKLSGYWFASKRLRLALITLPLLVILLPTTPLRVESAVPLNSDKLALPCPANLAGKFTSGWSEGEPAFQWYKFFGEHTFAAADTLKLSFAIIPSESGTTYVALDEIDGRTGYQFSFAGGLVNGAIPYIANQWNVVEIEFNFAAKEYVLAVNGVPSSPISFTYNDSNSVQALRVHFFGAGADAFAWFDSISVVKSSEGKQTTLFSATFDTGATYSASPGTVASLDPPDSYGVPAVCMSVAVLGVSPNVLEFSAFEGGGNPPPQSIYITDNGIVALPWAAEENVDWLSLNSIGGTTPAQIQVSVDISGLDPGVHTAQIVVSSDVAELGSPQVISVSLIVYPTGAFQEEPCPEGSAGNLSGEWYEYLGQHTFATTDTLEFAFSVVPSAPGTTLVAMDDTHARTAYQLYFFNGVVYDADHGNDFADDISRAVYTEGEWNTVRAEYSFATHQYTLSVNGLVTGPIPFLYNDLNSVQALRMHTFPSDPSAWIDTLSIQREDSTTAIYRNDFNGGALPDSYALPVTCSSPAAVLYVNPAVLEFSAVEGQGTPAPQSISIANNGTGSLSWTAVESITWLELSSTIGTAPATIDVTVDASGLSPGEYGGPIIILGDNAQNSPQTVWVHLLVEQSEVPPVDIVLATRPGYDNILLDWNPTNDPNVVAYRVWRAIGNSEDFTPAAITSDTIYLDNDPTLVVGTTYCYYVSALSFNDTVVQESSVDCAVFGQIELWVPDVWTAQGQTRVVPVNIRNATGLRIAAGDIWLNFDGAVIEILDISETSLTAGHTWAYAITSTETYSQVRIATLKTAPPTLYGEGALFWLTVKAIGTESDESPLELQGFVEGAGGSAIYTPDDLSNPVPLQLQNGVFHIADGGVLGDLNGNGVVQAVDAYIALQIASGELEPAVEQLVTGDVNGTGSVDAADAAMILDYAANGTWPSSAPSGIHSVELGSETSNTVVLSIDDVINIQGDVAQTTLRAENLSDWAGGEFVIVYDPRVIDAITNVEVTDLASGFAVQYHDEGMGLLHIALASDVPASGGGALAQISFHLAPTALSVGKTALALAVANLNDVAGRDFATSALQRTVVRHSGELRVGFPVYLPLIIK
jgi:hypothetical protein